MSVRYTDMTASEPRIELAVICNDIQNLMEGECNSRRALPESEALIYITFHAVYISLSMDCFRFLTKHFPTGDG
jgi:hypothetical protein